MSIQERVRQERIKELFVGQFLGSAQAIAQSMKQAGLRESDIKNFAKFLQDALKPVDALDYVKRRASKHGQWNAVASHLLSVLEQVRSFANEQQRDDIAAQARIMHEFVNLIHGMYVAL